MTSRVEVNTGTASVVKLILLANSISFSYTSANLVMRSMRQRKKANAPVILLFCEADFQRVETRRLSRQCANPRKD